MILFSQIILPPFFKEQVKKLSPLYSIFASQGFSDHSASHVHKVLWGAEWSEHPWLAKMLHVYG